MQVRLFALYKLKSSSFSPHCCMALVRSVMLVFFEEREKKERRKLKRATTLLLILTKSEVALKSTRRRCVSSPGDLQVRRPSDLPSLNRPKPVRKIDFSPKFTLAQNLVFWLCEAHARSAPQTRPSMLIFGFPRKWWVFKYINYLYPKNRNTQLS